MDNPDDHDDGPSKTRPKQLRGGEIDGHEKITGSGSVEEKLNFEVFKEDLHGQCGCMCRKGRLISRDVVQYGATSRVLQELVVHIYVRSC